MTWRNRFKLFFGLIFVVAVVGALTIYLNYSMSRIASQSAQLEAETFSLGSDYSGIVVARFVEKGQTVKKGDPLLTIKSALLASDLASNKVKRDALLYHLDKDNNIVMTATDDGVISNIKYPEGAFAPADVAIVEVYKSNVLYVKATYLLSPPDYARVQKNSTIEVVLPSNQKVQARISDISLHNSKDTVETTIRAKLDSFTMSGFAFTPGTPVKTTLPLEGKTLLTTVKEQIHKLRRRIQ